MKDKRPDTSLRAQSRVNWGRKQVDGIPTDEQLVAGALMRIADKLENGHAIPEYTIQHLISVAHRLVRMREKRPRKDQFHFTFEHPTRKTYFSLTIFGLTFSITAK